MSSVISVENLSKYYRLGVIGGGTLREDVNRWWAKVRGRPDPLLKVGMEDHGNRKNGEIWALRDINLKVKEGEILGVIGRNGAGKSTLLKILSRITAPTSGRAVIRGRVGSLLEVGTGFHPELTGRENVYLNGTILGMTRQEVTRKLDEIVAFSEMRKFIDTPVKRYSSGMRVRLAFAIAAHLEPEILIVDEVLAVGDSAFQKKCIGKMESVARNGRTILFVSHNMASIESLCSSCAILKRGQLEFKGHVGDAIKQYIGASHTLSATPLGVRTDRKGTQEAIIKKIDIIRNGELLSSGIMLHSGDEVSFQVVVSAKETILRGPIDIDLGVNDRNGDRLFWMSTHLTNGSVSTVKAGDTIFIFNIKRLPLSPGIYSITSCLRIGKETSDWVRDAIDFEVLHGNFFSLKAINLDTKSAILIEHSARKI